MRTGSRADQSKVAQEVLADLKSEKKQNHNSSLIAFVRMMMNGSKFLGLTAIFKDSTHLLGHRTTFFEQLDRKIEIEIERKVRAAEGRSEGGLRRRLQTTKWVVGLRHCRRFLQWLQYSTITYRHRRKKMF